MLGQKPQQRTPFPAATAGQEAHAPQILPPETDTAIPQEDDGTRKVQLSKPLRTHSGVVTQLTLQAPKASLFMNYGYPGRVAERDDGMGVISKEVIIDHRVATKYLISMTGHDEGVLGELSPGDFQKLLTVMMQMVSGAGN
jgi:hypothetical protein